VYVLDVVPVRVERGFVRLSADTTAPLLLVGAGTGIAPLRALMQHRAYLLNKNQGNGGFILNCPYRVFWI